MAVESFDLSFNGMQELQAFLDTLITKIEDAADKAADELADIGLKEMQSTYDSNPYKPESGMSFNIYKQDNERTVAMEGSQALYEEFGTGTIGERNPHPRKQESGLNPYNSGKTIRPATTKDNAISGIPVGELFWTYKDEKGKTRYTQGIPAGKEAYNAGQKVVQSAPDVLVKKIKEALL